MNLTFILIAGLLALAIGIISNQAWRSKAIFVSSLLAVFVLQPASPIRHLDFWLSTLSLALIAFTWAITYPRPQGKLELTRDSLVTGLVMVGIVVLVGLTRYLGTLCCITPTLPPEILQIICGLVVAVCVFWVLARVVKATRWPLILFISLIIVLFVVLKSQSLAQLASTGLRLLNQQSTDLALASDISWLGFSYIAFRLLHTLRDRQTGRLAAISLQDYVSYVIFFPALTAGPIDRADRFIKELYAPREDKSGDVLAGGERLVVGLFKKFALADTLALIALSSVNYAQVSSTLWMWVLLYAYSLRIYFDFSGYTDIAIGLGRWMGIKLPENFDHPYLKPNLTSFWNSWHMTLAQWFRSYIFNPLARYLRTRTHPLPAYATILICQLVTMGLIGLWHGISWNFLIWGVWHGIGLFSHNRWLEFSRTHFDSTPRPAWLQHLLNGLSTFFTFNYVTLGWIWFVLPLPAQSWSVMLKLFGI